MNLKELKAFSGENITEIKPRYTLQDSLTSMGVFANGILEAFDYTRNHFEEKNMLTYKFALDSIKVNVTDYTEAFLQSMIVIANADSDSRYNQLSTLRAVIRYFTSYCEVPESCQRWVEYLQKRNELVHEYNSYEFMTDELYSAVLNHVDDIVFLVDYLLKLATERNLLHSVMREQR